MVYKDKVKEKEYRKRYYRNYYRNNPDKAEKNIQIRIRTYWRKKYSKLSGLDYEEVKKTDYTIEDLKDFCKTIEEVIKND
jgi:patatin-like phospholipase/acyl hydrolase